MLATPWKATEAAIRSAGDLAGKIVIDCTNPLAVGPDGLGSPWGTRPRAARWLRAGLPVFRCSKP